MADDLVVETLRGGDLVAFAQCVALDVTVFPHPSIPAFDRARGMPPVWIARRERGGAVCGFAAATHVGRVLEIVGLAVAPSQRRRGVGRALVRAAIEGARVRRCSGVELQVSTANGAAVALYAGEGFERVRMLRGYYRGGPFGDAGNAWAMFRSLRFAGGRPA